jgi:phosphoglycerol transferase MdoB-like AlkP superfamily enzyme
MANVSSSSSSSSGIGLCGLLGVAFIVLKLTGVIDWSWWWVTAPLWGGFALAMIIIACAVGVTVWASRR